MTPTIYGKPISAEEAQGCMDNYGTIIKTVDDNGIITGITATDSKATAVKHYFSKKHNAFVFSKEMVTRFFTDTANADYLVVILGAQPKADAANSISKNDPTLILVGCTLDETGVFHSLDMTDPASEHPPESVIPTFPSTIVGVNPQISFKIQ